jgi:hypothetical protein
MENYFLMFKKDHGRGAAEGTFFSCVSEDDVRGAAERTFLTLFYRRQP